MHEIGADSLSMIIDSGAEEHVVTRTDWQSLREPLLQPAQACMKAFWGDGVVSQTNLCVTI